MQQLNNISIILVKPQMGENIGAAARVMDNFSIGDLRIVSPRDGWPNEKAIAMASHGEAVITNAKLFDSFSAAVADLHLLFATTSRERDLNKPAITPEHLVSSIPEGAKVGIVFGAERTGLENADISLCHKILYVPVNPKNKSLNLAQTVAIICYELFKASENAAEQKFSNLKNEDPPATISDYNSLFSFLEAELDKANFFQVDEKKPKMMDNIRSIFTKLEMSQQQMRTLRGILKSINQK